MRRYGRHAAVGVVLLMVAAALVLPSAEAQKVSNPGSFTLTPVNGFMSIGATSLSLAPRPLAECGDGVDNDGDAKVDYPTDPQCTSTEDDSEVASGAQAKGQVVLTGTVDAAGNVNIPTSGVSFPTYYLPIRDPNPNLNYIYPVAVYVVPTAAATGVIDPMTGVANLRLRFRIRLSGTVAGVYLGANCYIGTTAAPIDINTLASSNSGGIPYSATTGRATLANNTFSVPGTSTCDGVTGSVINAQLGLPSASGNNAAVIEGQANPILGRGVVARITTDPAVLNGAAPFTVNFDSATSTVTKAPATYRWNFPDGTVVNAPTASTTFNSAGTHTVQLTVTDGDGDQSVALKNVVVTSGTTTTTTTVPTTTTTSTTTTTEPTTTTTTTIPTTTTTSTTTTTTEPTTTTTTTVPTTTTTTTTTTVPTTTTTTTTTTIPTTTTTSTTTTTTEPTTTTTTTVPTTTTTTTTPPSADSASVQLNGSYSYTNDGSASAGGVTVVRDTSGIVRANGSIDIPGTSGGSARLTVNAQRFWVFQLWTGQVSLYDQGAGVSVAAPVFGSLSNAPGANAVTGTSSWFTFGSFPNLVRPFTITWTVDDAS